MVATENIDSLRAALLTFRFKIIGNLSYTWSRVKRSFVTNTNKLYRNNKKRCKLLHNSLFQAYGGKWYGARSSQRVARKQAGKTKGDWGEDSSVSTRIFFSFARHLSFVPNYLNAWNGLIPRTYKIQQNRLQF